MTRNKRDEAYDIRRIYEQMELDLIRSMKRNLGRHELEEEKMGFKFEQWQSAKLRDLERFRRENRAIIGQYSGPIEKHISSTLLETYKESQDNVSRFVKQIQNTLLEGITAILPGDLEPILDTVDKSVETVDIDICTDLTITSCKLLDGENLLSDVEFNGKIPSESVMLLVLSKA